MSIDELLDAIVIGGGQAGLAAGYYLSQRGAKFAILDENDRPGASWRSRWDSLRLFTPSQNDYLPGMKFPKPDYYFPTKDEVAEFLETYASHFSLPVRPGVRVDRLSKNGGGFQISAGTDTFHAHSVIIATGAFRSPHIPAVAQELDPGLFQMHSSQYHNPGEVPVNNLAVVGAGNSGAEIAIELSNSGKKVFLAGRDVGRIPAEKLGGIYGGRPYWWFLRRVLTNNTPIGRKMRDNSLLHGSPLVRARREAVAEAGVELIPRIAGTNSGHPVVDGGQALPVEGILWATGYRPDYHWIDLPVFDAFGLPRHKRGVVSEAPGLFFIGLQFQTGITSSLLGGVGEDAKYITSLVEH